MEPLIRNQRNTPRQGIGWDLISESDNPAACTMRYMVIEPNQASKDQHAHPWEHVMYILEGSGVIVCDSKEFPVKEGDGILVPPNVNHYPKNTARSGVLRCVQVAPTGRDRKLITESVKGAGQPPVIRNYRTLDPKRSQALMRLEDGLSKCHFAHFTMAPAQAVRDRHTHHWQHMSYIASGSPTIEFGGKDYPLREGDAVMLPVDVEHQWKNLTPTPAIRLDFNELHHA